MANSVTHKKGPGYRVIYQNSEEIPYGLRCPRCHHDHEIVVCRGQKHQSLVNRWMFFQFRCGVCDFRFRHARAGGIVTFLFATALLIALPFLLTYVQL